MWLVLGTIETLRLPPRRSSYYYIVKDHNWLNMWDILTNHPYVYFIPPLCQLDDFTILHLGRVYTNVQVWLRYGNWRINALTQRGYSKYNAFNLKFLADKSIEPESDRPSECSYLSPLESIIIIREYIHHTPKWE